MSMTMVLLSFFATIVPTAMALALFVQSPTSEAVSEKTGPVLATVFAWQLLLGSISCLILYFRLAFPLARLTGLLKTSSQPSGMAGDATLVEQCQELISSRDEYAGRERVIAEATTDLLVSFDQDLNIVCANASIALSLQFLPEELLGKCFVALLLPEDADRCVAAIASGKANQQPIEFDNRVLTKAKSAIDVHWTIEWSATESCYFACGQDITDQKTLERAKNEFMAMIGHDIKSPLSSVAGALQTIQLGVYGDISGSCQEMLEKTQQSLARLMALINDLLDLEKVSLGKLVIKKAPVSLATIMEATLADTAALAGQKNIEMRADIYDVEISADADKLVRVFTNLVSNAIKFSPPDSRIVISVNKRARVVEVRVTDSGPGIASEYHHLIFERYERTPGTLAIEGTGLGLAIARAIVQGHDGLIGVDSELGKGSTFWVKIPLAK